MNLNNYLRFTNDTTRHILAWTGHRIDTEGQFTFSSTPTRGYHPSSIMILRRHTLGIVTGAFVAGGHLALIVNFGEDDPLRFFSPTIPESEYYDNDTPDHFLSQLDSEHNIGKRVWVNKLDQYIIGTSYEGKSDAVQQMEPSRCIQT